ncbi:MAG TPA: 5'-nucleotidase [Candidatus Limnocylindrales bacterium]
MPYSLTGKLVVGISSRALFDLDEADQVFRRDGLAAYREFQRAHEGEVLGPGTAMPLIKGLLAIDGPHTPEADRLVEVILLSRNDADSAMRLFSSIEAYGLRIHRGAFTSGRDPWPYLRPLQCSLFLSANPDDVFHARAQGFPAALALPLPQADPDEDVGEVRIAFDGDAVLFGEQSELLFQREGLDAFQEHESARSAEPLSPGPFAPFLLALKRIQDRFPEGRSPIRTALVTARGAPTHTRVVNTLRAWGVRMDETFFLGGIDKAPVLEALRPHIFFDDQLTHLREAQRRVPSAHVVPERQQLALFDDEQVAAPVPAAPLVVLPPRARPEAAAEASPATRPAAAPTEPLPGLVDLSGAASRSARRG